MTELRRWDKVEFRNHVVMNWGGKQLQTLMPSLVAVSSRLEHSKFHYSEIKRLISTHLDNRAETEQTLLRIMFPSADEELIQSHEFFVQCGAHMIACAQAIHATADILAHVVYFGLGLNIGIDEEKLPRIYLATMCHRHDSPHERVVQSGIGKRLETLRTSTAFKEIEGLVNQSKHRGGPTASLTMLFSGDKAYEMRFSSYVRGQYCPSRAAEEVLAPAFEAINSAVVDVGIALNNWLRASNGV